MKRKAPAFSKSKVIKMAKAPKIRKGFYGQGKLKKILKSMGAMK